MESDSKTAPLVLVVEDDPDVARLIQLELELEGYRVSLASTGSAGLDLARQLQPDVLIIDGMLPELGGFHVLQRLKSEDVTSHIPVIYISARSNPEEARQAVESGAAKYFSKPFEPAELISSIKSILSGRGST
ncbi:MAG: two-component system response regulator [Acidimicrobiia bacterium]